MATVSEKYSHTCITCRVAFARAELQRDHYKSDWHRYNLKRKVAELPSVSAEVFQQKVTEMKATVATPDIEIQRCIPCNKAFQSAAAFENHCKSKKHVEIEKKHSSNNSNVDLNLIKPRRLSEEAQKQTDVSEIEEVVETQNDSEDEWEGEGLGVEECLFCSTVSTNMDENLKHMSLSHGFFIPDAEYCTDVEGLMMYLGEKVGIGNVCLWCNDRGKSFQSLDGVQKHMRDKGHCKMMHDGEAMLEYAEYFDYSTSYPAAEQAGEDELDNDVELPVLEQKDWQLVLPSGATIGHRSLMRYYRQNLKPEKQIAVPNKRQTVHRLLNAYKALGWTETSGNVAQRKARDLRFMNKLQAKYRLTLGTKSNKLQTHFRSQVMF